MLSKISQTKTNIVCHRMWNIKNKTNPLNKTKKEDSHMKRTN